jgi:hypothetical protein
VASIADIRALGVYLTTAVKCGKTGYGIATGTVKTCAATVLRSELALFPNVRAWLLMGDIAIRAVNEVARLCGEPRVIPAGSTYKIRGQVPSRGAGLPSYLQASFFIEKARRDRQTCCGAGACIRDKPSDVEKRPGLIAIDRRVRARGGATRASDGTDSNVLVGSGQLYAVTDRPRLLWKAISPFS